jgi:GNAT superfamily N-acetyltransferase
MTVGQIRAARPEDVPEILALVRELADYERAAHEVVATEDDLTAALFGGTSEAPGATSTTPNGHPAAYCFVIDHPTGDGRRIGAVALWFLNFSTWLGRHGIYLEDLYVRPQLRGLGYGQALLSRLARECVDRGYGRLEWWVLDWNDPALGFYRSLGAEAMDEWTVHRVSGDELQRLADRASGTE